MILIFSTIVAVVLVLLIVIALQPDQFSVSRSSMIDAPAERVFLQVNNLHNWQAWSPWAKLDPKAKTTYDGPPEGVGAGYAWNGSKSGAGHMAITESRPHQFIRFRLDFEKPFKATNTVEFTFKPQGEGTVVTWTMSGTNNFFCKAIGLIISCDKMCGSQFEKGLADMKSIAEAEESVRV